MTAPLVYRNDRNPYYKRDNLHIGFIIPSVLTVSENHCAKPWEPIIDHVGNSDVKKLANLNVNKESCGAATDVFMDKALHWITVGIDNRGNTLLKLPGYEPKTQGAALKQWLESNITDENNQIRLQDICAGIPVGLKKIVRLYVDIRLSMYPNEWNSLRNLYGNDSNYYLEQVGICINKSDTEIDRLNWINIGLLRLKFEEWLKQTRSILNNDKDAIKLVVEIKKLFWDILLDETSHRADEIQKKLRQLKKSVSNTDNNAEGGMVRSGSNSNHEVPDMSNSDLGDETGSGDDTEHSNHDEPDSKVDGEQSVSKECTQYFDEADLQNLAKLDYSSKSLDLALDLVQKKIFDWKILFDPDFYQRVISNNNTEVVYTKGLDANLLAQLVEWLTSNERDRTHIMRNAISLVAELIDRRKSDSCKYIPIGTQQIIESYVGVTLKVSSSLEEWDSLLKRHSKCGPISDILEKICQLINGIDKYGKFLSPTARLYWIRIGQLRVRFEHLKRDNAISIEWPFTTQQIELEFVKALESRTPQNVDRIEKPLKCLADVGHNHKRNCAEPWKVVITKWVGKDDFEMLAGLDLNDESSVLKALEVLKAVGSVESLWNQIVKDINCEEYLLKLLLDWLTFELEPTTDESKQVLRFFRVVAELIDRRPDSTKYIPTQIHNAIQIYLNLLLKAHKNQWYSMLEQYQNDNGTSNTYIAEVCQFIEGSDRNGNCLSPTARLNWIRFGKLWVQFDLMKRDNAISKKWPFTTQQVELEFVKTLKSQTPQNVDQIEELLKDLPDVCGDLKRSISARELIPQTIETCVNHASKEKISANVKENILPNSKQKGNENLLRDSAVNYDNEDVTRKPKPRKKRWSKWLKWLKRGVSLKGAIPITRGNPVALAA